MDEELISLRVQYLVDTDPFSSLSIYPVPARAPVYSFIVATPLANQIGALLRFLNGAPQRVRDMNMEVLGMKKFVHTCLDAFIMLIKHDTKRFYG